MRALVINQDTLSEVARVVEYANAHPERLGPLLQRIGKPDAAPIGDNPGHQCTIPMGFLACYSHEEQPKLGFCRHLSVSLLGTDKAPNEHAFIEIAKLFGFTGDFTEWHIWIEDTQAGRKAINALQEI